MPYFEQLNTSFFNEPARLCYSALRLQACSSWKLGRGSWSISSMV